MVIYQHNLEIKMTKVNKRILLNCDYLKESHCKPISIKYKWCNGLVCLHKVRAWSKTSGVIPPVTRLLDSSTEPSNDNI